MNVPKIRPIDQLIKQGFQTQDINEKASEILIGIQEEIKSALEQGKDNVIYTLPTHFVVSGMNNSSSQQNIYYKVLTTLHKSGYIAKLKFIGRSIETQRVLLNVSWKTPLMIGKELEMNEYIAKHTIQ